jgi:hypothetical protein
VGAAIGGVAWRGPHPAGGDIGALYDRYAGDPQRVAVAALTGPDNVAPPSSPTPYLRDLPDANGAPLSDAVAKVTGRLGVMAQSGVLTDKATALARVDRDFAEDPVLGAAVADRVDQRYADIDMRSAATEKAEADALAAAQAGYVRRLLDPRATPASLLAVGDDIDRDPVLAGSASTLQQAKGFVAQRIAEVAQGRPASDGDGYWPAYRRLFLPEGDPNRLADAASIWRLAGSGDGGVTLQGAQKLDGVREALADPASASAEQAKKQVFEAAHRVLTWSDDGRHLPDPRGEALFGQWLGQAEASYADGSAAGKTPAQLLAPGSKDYIGATAAGFQRSPEAWFRDRMEAAHRAVGATAPGPRPSGAELDRPQGRWLPFLAHPEDIVSAVQSNWISPKEAELMAIERGFIVERGEPRTAQPATAIEDDTAGGPIAPASSPGPAAARPSRFPSYGPRWEGVPVRLPDDSTIPEPEHSPTGQLMSPVGDLSQVAAAGRQTGSTFFSLVGNGETGGGAMPYLLSSLAVHLGHGGRFDYQRVGNHITGFTQLPQFRDVSNVNVGLFAQQAGLSLDQALSCAGSFASVFSGNAKSDEPHGLDTETAKFIKRGFEIGQSGVFGPPAAP